MKDMKASLTKLPNALIMVAQLTKLHIRGQATESNISKIITTYCKDNQVTKKYNVTIRNEAVQRLIENVQKVSTAQNAPLEIRCKVGSPIAQKCNTSKEAAIESQIIYSLNIMATELENAIANGTLKTGKSPKSPKGRRKRAKALSPYKPQQKTISPTQTLLSTSPLHKEVDIKIEAEDVQTSANHQTPLLELPKLHDRNALKSKISYNTPFTYSFLASVASGGAIALICFTPFTLACTLTFVGVTLIGICYAAKLKATFEHNPSI